MYILLSILVTVITIIDAKAVLCNSVESNTCNILYTAHSSDIILCDQLLPNCNITCLHSCSNTTIVTKTNANVHIKLQSVNNSNMIIYAPIHGILTISTTNPQASFQSNVIYSTQTHKHIFFSCMNTSKCKHNIIRRIQSNTYANRILLSNDKIYDNKNMTTTQTSTQANVIVLSNEIIYILIGVVVIFICCAFFTLISTSVLCVYAKRQRQIFTTHNIANNCEDINKLPIPQRMLSIGSISATSIETPQSHSSIPAIHRYPSQISLHSKTSHSKSKSTTRKEIKFANMNMPNNTSQINHEKQHNYGGNNINDKQKQRIDIGNMDSRYNNNMNTSIATKTKRSTITSNNNTFSPPTIIELKLTNLESESDAECESQGNNNKTRIIMPQTSQEAITPMANSNDSMNNVPDVADIDDIEFNITVNKLAFNCAQIVSKTVANKKDVNHLTVTTDQKSSDDTESSVTDNNFMADYMNAPISHCRDHKGSIYNLSEAHHNLSEAHHTVNFVQQIMKAQASI